MRDINNFFSSNKYIYLPSKNNPKVILAVDDKLTKNNSFKLYNPFSLKAKVFKLLVNKICDINIICNMFTENHQNSEFLDYLNDRFNKKFISSVYVATEKDKVVLQLQADNNIFGYVKFPLKEVGRNRILNEKEAIEIFNDLGIRGKYILFDEFKKNPFLVLNPIEGKFKIYNKNEILKLLNKFKKNKKYLLKDHPRIKNLQELIKNENFLYTRLNKIVNSSKEEYELVYEHGDFAPWNIIKKNNKIIPFDFEYFEKEGLEWMDFVKYYYQIGKLLKKYKNKNLINFVLSKLDFKEKEIIFKIFLFKEISLKIKENKVYDNELSLLKIMEEG